MRVAADIRQLEVDPGATAAVVLEVVNNEAVIDGVTARVIGMPQECVSAQPTLLPLFPDTSGQMTLSLAVPSTYPAGRHPLTVEVVSHGARQPARYLDVDVDVSSRPGMRVLARPRMVRARRGARFVLEITNTGNVPLDVAVTATDPDRSTTTTCTPARVHVAPGAIAPVLLGVRGPRMFTGADIDRSVTVDVAAYRLDLPPDAIGSDDAVATGSALVQLRQRPLISRGLLTALILASIVLLWAGVFLFGLTKVFSGDPMTKQAPASFFAAQGKTGSGSGAKGGGSGGSAGGGSGATPAGALSKTGQLPPGLGGQITGTVVSANDLQPVGRILVQAERVGRDGIEQVSAAATQADGTFTLGGLFPTTYYLKFTADGYHSTWYHGSQANFTSAVTEAGAPGGASPVTVDAQHAVTGLTIDIKGVPATIKGSVASGDALKPPHTAIRVRPLLGGHAGSVVKTTTTTGSGKYTVAGLPAPATYELSFVANGFQPTTIVQYVGGGDVRLEPGVTLGASQGQITGIVTDGGTGLGGVTVTTTVGGKNLAVVTPTTGQVGTFALSDLPTPGTYILTFAAPGHGTQTRIVALAAGQRSVPLSVAMVNGTTSITGHVSDDQNNPLGGVTVTIGGTGLATAPTTTTLTEGAKGDFVLNGLPPGSYTVTFTLAGFTPTSAPVEVTGDSLPKHVDVTLRSNDGEIDGTVIDGGKHPFEGASITATDGLQVWHAKSASIDGSFVIAGLQPGAYSVTVTAPGMRQQTAIVHIPDAGGKTPLTLHLFKAGG